MKETHAFFKGQLVGKVVGTVDGKPALEVKGRDLVIPLEDTEEFTFITTIRPEV
jgi:hypothetical protein